MNWYYFLGSEHKTTFQGFNLTLLYVPTDHRLNPLITENNTIEGNGLPGGCPKNSYLWDNPTFSFLERSSYSKIILLCSSFLPTSTTSTNSNACSEPILSGSQINRQVLSSTDSPKIYWIPTMWKVLLGTQKLIRHYFHLLELMIKCTTHR